MAGHIVPLMGRHVLIECDDVPINYRRVLKSCCGQMRRGHARLRRLCAAVWKTMMDTVNDNILEKERLWNKQLFDETDREENNHCENGKVIHCKNEGIFASDNDTDLASLAGRPLSTITRKIARTKLLQKHLYHSRVHSPQPLPTKPSSLLSIIPPHHQR
jgi:hypothetical protein